MTKLSIWHRVQTSMKKLHLWSGLLLLIAGCIPASNAPQPYDPSHFNGWPGKWQSDRPLVQGKSLIYSYMLITDAKPIKSVPASSLGALDVRDSISGQVLYFDSLRTLNDFNSASPFLSNQEDSIGLRFIGNDSIAHYILGWPVHDTLDAIYDSSVHFRFIRISS